MIFRVIEGVPDFHEIIDLINALWPPEFGEKTDSEKLADMAESHMPEKDRLKYLYDNGKAIGFYRYSLWPRDARQTDVAHLYDISVLPAYQKTGIGMMMMNDLLSDCRERGLKKLLSRSFKNNEGSINLHRKAGFRVSFETEDSIVWETNIDCQC